MKLLKPRNKYLRFNTPGQPHGLSFSCYRNRKFLNYKRTRLYLVDSINKAREKHQFDIWAYVIMPEHLHLLIFPKEDVYSISEILKSIKQPVARRTITYLRKNKPGLLCLLETGLITPKYRFWQDGGGYDRNIRSLDELTRFRDYAHNNPVRRGLVDNPEQWYWSSARDWISGIRGPIKLDKESFPLM